MSSSSFRAAIEPGIPFIDPNPSTRPGLGRAVSTPPLIATFSPPSTAPCTPARPAPLTGPSVPLMKPSLLVVASLLATGLMSAASAQDAKAPPGPSVPADLQDPTAQANYAIGLNLGTALRRDGVPADPRTIARGLQDGLSGAAPALTEEQMQAAITQLKATVQAHQEEKAAHAAETNKAEGAAFLKANAAKPGVVTLPDGLQYQILKAGTGPTPKADDTVVCNYRGTLIGGATFDTSDAHGGPSTFAVSGVIKGWTEALQRMPTGSKWRLFVPAELAYGEKGAGREIGPNATLIFEVELISIQPKA